MTYKEIALRLYEACFGASILSQDEQTRIETLLFDDDTEDDYLMCGWCGRECSNDEISYDDHYSEYVCNWCANGGRR